MTQLTCPACGSHNITQQKEIKKIFTDHLDKETHIETLYEECQECGMDGEFSIDNDEIINNALADTRSETISKILTELSNHHSLAGIERSLDLPQRTLSKWKNGTKPTRSGTTLVKLIAIFPWLIKIAQSKYNPEKMAAIFGHACVDYHLNMSNDKPPFNSLNFIGVQQNNINISFTVNIHNDSTTPKESKRINQTQSELTVKSSLS
ncbi:hypothetical protein [Desulfotalea psychrophila]|uniref:Uncharacterized protein n=1 Tax=Desulfotalea psychrophila (strain LSv54 / DSM 12343) TaxID=177439 RepID=Q6ALK0_DESPS|nr:hypothetical protein [Desulfotalea psychrophila]CAG36775.1 unknown protein [Desulfotalea psychrophila LSv54]